jgi:hypothetical protein
VRQIARALKPGGPATLLTQEKRLITDLITRHGRLELREYYPLSLSGLRPTIYVVRKTEASE